ncbi:hypothetical protein [Cupriavidus sp. BIC8F]|uniref:hypothetical protein n=1 Tax=Cupriavidus sp. BIC8F TaxID=3079014 RepID=UPI002917042B|nr:hypothetical protein [Cupriavidus sp. BIC8F]
MTKKNEKQPDREALLLQAADYLSMDGAFMSLADALRAARMIRKLARGEALAQQPQGEARQAPKDCQHGYGDICAAGARDGVVCPEDSCDIDDGIRAAPSASAQQADDMEAFDAWAEDFVWFGKQSKAAARDAWIACASRYAAPAPSASPAALTVRVQHDMIFILNVLEDVSAAMPPSAAHRITTGKAIEKARALLAAAPADQDARDAARHRATIPEGWDIETVSGAFSTVRYVLGVPAAMAGTTPNQHWQEIIAAIAAWPLVGDVLNRKRGEAALRAQSIPLNENAKRLSGLPYQVLFNAIAAATTAKGNIGISIIEFRKSIDAAMSAKKEGGYV